MGASMTVKGLPQLQARIEALRTAGPAFTRKFAPAGLRYVKIETPHRTGNLSRSNYVLAVNANAVYFANRAKYALAVHEGSRPHIIVPRTRRALRFGVGAGVNRLSGTPRSGAKRSKGRGQPGIVFSKRVKHPGNKANPFMMRGLQLALSHVGLSETMIERWNGAA